MTASPRARRRIVLLALGGLCGLLALLLFGLFPQEPLRRYAEGRLQAATSPASRIGSFTVRPFRMEAEITGLVVQGPTYSLHADRAVAVGTWGLLRGHGLFLKRLELEAPRLVFRPDPNVPESSPLALQPIRVEDVVVTRAELEYHDPALARPATVKGVGMKGSLGSGRELHISGAHAAWPGLPEIDGEATVSVSELLDVDLVKLEARTGHSTVTAKGPTVKRGVLEPDVTFSAKLDASELARLASASPPPADGSLRIDGRAWVEAGVVNFQSTKLQADRLVVSGWAIEDLEGTATHGADGSQVNVHAGLAGGDVRLEARHAAEQKRAALRGRLTLTGVDLTALPRDLGLAETVRHGRASGVLSFEGDPSAALQVDGQLHGTGVARDGTEVALTGRASGPVRLAGEPRVDLRWSGTLTGRGARAAAWESAQLELEGRAEGALPPTVTGTVRGPIALRGLPQAPEPSSVEGTFASRDGRVSATVNVAGFGAPLRATLETPRTGPARVRVHAESLDLARLRVGLSGTVVLTFEGRGPLSALSGEGALDVRGLNSEGLAAGPVSAKITAKGGAFDLAFSLPDWKADGVLHLPANGSRIGLVAHLRETSLAPLGARFLPGRVLSGHVSADLKAEGDPSRPREMTAQADIGAASVTVDEWSAATRAPFAVRFAKGLATLDGLRVAGDGFALEASGTTGLDPSSEVTAQLTADLDLTRLPLPQDTRLEGQAKADLRVTGTRVRPHADGGIDLRGVSASSAPSGPITVADTRIQLAGESAVLEALTAEVWGGSVAVSARVPLAAIWDKARAQANRVGPDEAAQIALTWSNLDLADAVARAAPARAGLAQGRLSGRANLSGGLRDAKELTGSVDVPATSLTVQELAVEIAPVALAIARGEVRTDAVRVETAGTSLTLAGAVDLPKRTLQATGRGALELRALSPFLTETALGGRAELDVSAAGTFDAPQLNGRVAVREGTVRMRAMPESLTDISLDVSLAQDAIRVTDGRARLGGGPLTLSGEARLAGAAVADVRLAVQGRDMAVRYPPGMRSRLDADLTFAGRPGAFALTGLVTAQRGLYDLDVALSDSLTAAVVTSEESPFMRSVTLDLRVETARPMQVRNNLADIRAGGRLTVRGDLQAPAPVGTLEVEPGGRVYLQGREFNVQHGRLTYEGDWDPSLALEARNKDPIQDGPTRYDITAKLDGRLTTPSLTFSSPQAKPAEILSLLTTGTTRASGEDAFLRMAGGQAAALLVGRVSRSLRGLGLEEAILQPEVVTEDTGVDKETQLGARLTVAKRLSAKARAVSSLSLQKPEDHFVRAQLQPRSAFELYAQRGVPGGTTVGAGQTFRLGRTGASRESPPEVTTRLGEVRLQGDADAENLRTLLGVRLGAKRTAWQLHDDADDLREELRRSGYVEAEVAARLEGTTAVFTVRKGPRYAWRIEGLPGPPNLEKAVQSALFEDEALEKGRDVLLAELHRRGFWRARVEDRVLPGDPRVLSYVVTPGRALRVDARFPGVYEVSAAEVAKAAGGAGAFLTDAPRAVAGVIDFYRKQQYLSASVEEPRIEEHEDGVTMVVSVDEGPRARLAGIRFTGTSQPADELRRVTGLSPGAPWDDKVIAGALDRVRAHYFSLGYSEARLDARAEAAPPDVELVVKIAEGERRTVGAIEITGLKHMSPSRVRRRLALSPGDPLDPRRLARAEVELTALQGISRAMATIGEGNPARITIAITESERAVAGYQLSHSSEDGNDVRLDGELGNLLGRGATIGGRYRVGADLREARALFRLPVLWGDLTLVGTRQEEDLDTEEEEPEGMQDLRRQTEVQARYGLQASRALRFEAGYRFKRVVVQTEFVDAVVDLGGFDLSAVHDTRDSPFDARRGHFVSLSAHLAPKGLRSDFTFGKALLQASLARPLRGLTWAQAFRLGLGRGFAGQEIRSTERFFAGGGNSVRGFDTEALGPLDRLGDPLGGEAVVVVNQELRYRHPWGLGGVVFYDAGNVFAKAKDMSLKLRHSVGAGVRWQSPVGLVRVDVGFPLRREPGEKAYRLFYSLGQAF